MGRLAAFEEFPEFQITIELYKDTKWEDVSPIIDAIPNEQVAVRVEKIAVGVGGVFDIPPFVQLVPAGVAIIVGKMLLNLADDLYAAAKPKIIQLYHKITKFPDAERFRALSFDLTSDTLDATFWIPMNLSDEEFGDAWTSMRRYFEELRSKNRSGAVVLEFDPSRGWWVDERQTEFWLTIPPDQR